MLILLALAIAFAAFVTFSFLRKQNNIVNKYSFFQLRDEIAYLLIEGGNDDELLQRYKRVKLIASNLKRINFNFFVEVTAEVIRPLLDANAKHRAEMPSQKSSPNTEKIDIKLLRLLMQTGKQNSIRLRFAMTSIGRHILLAPAFFHLYRKHPEIFRKKRQQIETLQTYADLAQNRDSYCLA